MHFNSTDELSQVCYETDSSPSVPLRFVRPTAESKCAVAYWILDGDHYKATISSVSLGFDVPVSPAGTGSPDPNGDEVKENDNNARIFSPSSLVA
eukprot:Awhi_evm1s12209